MSLIRNAGIAAVIIYFLTRKGDNGNGNGFIAPVQGTITSGFGMRIHPITKVPTMHTGVDISAPRFTPIVAPKAGTVVNIFTGVKGGRQLKLRHNDGWLSGFAHLDDWNVLEGMEVPQGATIGFVGDSGQVTGPHLHYTLRDENNVYVDPEEYINFNPIA